MVLQVDRAISHVLHEITHVLHKECQMEYAKEYTHHMCEGLKNGLTALYNAAEPMKISQLKELSFAERTNFQKLQYWGLIRKLGRNSLWAITDRGIEFVQGKVSIGKRVTTLNAIVQDETKDDQIFYHQCTEGFATAGQYARGEN